MADREQPGTDQMTVLGPQTEFQGRLVCRGEARILGSFEGEILSEHEVQIGEGAECHATIQAARIVVEGLLEGDLTASDRVRLGPKARVRGDLIAGGLIVAEGASFCGHCTVGPEIAAAPSAPQNASPERTPARAAPVGARAPRIETRAVTPTPATPASSSTSATTTPKLAAANTRGDGGGVGGGANSLALATAELENDPEWQSLSR